VFLYNPAVVTFVDAGAASVNRSTTGTQVVKQKGEPALTLSPGRIDPANPVWTASRKPLVGEFEFNGQDGSSSPTTSTPSSATRARTAGSSSRPRAQPSSGPARRWTEQVTSSTRSWPSTEATSCGR